MVFSSYLFIFFFLPWFCLLMLFNTSVDYTNDRLMGAYPARKKLFVTISIVCDLAILGFFRYFNFGLDNYNATMAALGIPEAQYLGFFRVVLPLGISFYTFQSMSYVIDVYRGDAKVVTNFIDYACYGNSFVRQLPRAFELFSRNGSLSICSGISVFKNPRIIDK